MMDATDGSKRPGIKGSPKSGMAAEKAVKQYFVDEAGDLVLFDKKGRIIVGNGSVPLCFMVGFVDLPDPDLAHRKLEELRQELLADPYFSGVPSMQPEKKRTARFFHAKDDPWEVKREVIKLLPSLGARVVIGIRRKGPLANRHLALFKRTGQKFKENPIYDQLITEIFRDEPRLADESRVTFAHRGKRNRARELKGALAKAGYAPVAPFVKSAYPYEAAGLQVVDYYLWAVQRIYERGEDRFFRALESQYELIIDLDDKRKSPCGERYSNANKLEIAKIKPFAS